MRSTVSRWNACTTALIQNQSHHCHPLHEPRVASVGAFAGIPKPAFDGAPDLRCGPHRRCRNDGCYDDPDDSAFEAESSGLESVRVRTKPEMQELEMLGAGVRMNPRIHYCGWDSTGAAFGDDGHFVESAQSRPIQLKATVARYHFRPVAGEKMTRP